MATGKRGRKKSVFDTDFQELTEQENATGMKKKEQEKEFVEENEVELLEESIQPDIDENEVGNSFNPLQGEVIRREYAQQVGVANIPEVDRVPEPSISNLPPPPPPPSNRNNDSPFIGGDNPSSGGSAQSSATMPPPPPQEPLNPEMVNLSNKDAKLASTRLVDSVLSGYKQFWGLAYEYIKVPEDKIIQWVMNDEISLDIKLSTGAGETSLRDVYDMFNSQAKEALDVDLQDEDFVKVREAMIREFTKRGWGVTDFQYIIQHFVRDSGQKIIMLYQLNGSINAFTNATKKQYEELKKLREELTNVKERVENSAPTTINRPKSPEKQYKEVVNDSKDFVETYEIKNDSGISEVPHYEGVEEIQSGQNIVPIDNSTF